MKLLHDDAWYRKQAAEIGREFAEHEQAKTNGNKRRRPAPEFHAVDDDISETTGIPADELEDAVDVAQEGRAIEAAGVPYTWDGIIPAYGMLGFLVAYTKVGKTTFGQAVAAHVASGEPFLDRPTTATRVLILAAEDPPEYTAWLARHLQIEKGRILFRRKSLLLSATSLQHIAVTVTREQIGLVLIASWQSVVRGLIENENDNAGAVQIVENVKAVARTTKIPWVIDAHSGKGEDQDDDADPSRAMRGASAAAGAADYTLSLRYANGTFGSRRRFSGKGRFVSFAPLTLDFDQGSSSYSVVGAAKDVTRETTWRLLCETGALDATPKSVGAIARIAGMVADGERLAGSARRRIYDALRGRADVLATDEIRRGQKTTLFQRVTTV